MIRLILITLSVVLIGCSGTQNDETVTKAKKPNIILIVADDLGYSDLSSYGSPLIETPNLDRLAQEGMRFTRGYAAAPLCSPTRASIVTGLNPARINLTVHIHGNPPTPKTQKLITPKTAQAIDTALTTMPEVLSAAGYKTGHIGKWHLGGGPFSPQYQGYHMAYGGSWAALPGSFFYPFFGGDAYPELKADAEEGDYLTDVLTNRALKYIEDNKDTTFFLTLNYYSPHVPVEAKADKVAKYEKKADSLGIEFPNAHYAAMVESIDENVGRVVKLVSELGLDENTLVAFTSDNGGLHVVSTPAFIEHTPPTINDPLREGKGTVYEGGIREPFIFRWKGKITPGVESDAVITTNDLMNTFSALSESSYRTTDGIDVTPALFGEELPSRKLFMHFPHYTHQGGYPGGTVHEGNYKLIHWYESDSLELYDVVNDPGETINIADQNIELVDKLYKDLQQWKQSINAHEVEPNPEYQEEELVE